MHILHTEASCGWGGQEIRILEESRGLISHGHNVKVLCPRESRIFEEAPKYGVPSIALPIGKKNLKGLFALRSWLKKHKVDVINTHSSTDTWLAALARVTSQNSPPIIRTRHISSPIPDNWTSKWLYTKAVKHVVTTGEALRKQVIEETGADPARVTSVPTGIDPSRFKPGNKHAARTKLNIESDTNYIGIVATLRSWKGHIYLLEAFSKLNATNWKLLIVGNGPYLDVLQEKAESLGITDKVIFAGQQSNPETWLQAMDIFCLPSYANEGVPQAILQAMFTALPIVTTTVGAITEAVKEKDSALIVPYRDSDSLAHAILDLINNPILAETLKNQARQRALEHFTLETMLSHTEHVLQQYAGKKRKAGFRIHLARLQKSLNRTIREQRLPDGYTRFGSKYGGWWINTQSIDKYPLLIDCGLGEDISFPTAFLKQYPEGNVVGVDPNPRSLEYSRRHCPPGMKIIDAAFWSSNNEPIIFYLPRSQEQLPQGADGVSGSLDGTHEYVIDGEKIETQTINLEAILNQVRRDKCNILKLDIEGAEYELINNLINNKHIHLVEQLLIEFHHDVTHHTKKDTDNTIEKLKQAGFRLMHTESRNYIFQRQNN